MRFVALAASAVVFLLTTIFLLLATLPGPLAIVIAASVSSALAVLLTVVKPDLGWRWGIWASAAFLGYFSFVTVVYWWTDRPEWHPVLAGIAVTGGSCLAAWGAAALRESRRRVVR
jgi:hypothetical protein